MYLSITVDDEEPNNPSRYLVGAVVQSATSPDGERTGSILPETSERWDTVAVGHGVTIEDAENACNEHMCNEGRSWLGAGGLGRSERAHAQEELGESPHGYYVWYFVRELREGENPLASS